MLTARAARAETLSAVSTLPMNTTLRAGRAAALPSAQVLVLAATGAGLVAVAMLLRTSALGAGYWTDEGIAVGLAGHPLGEIPGLLRMDGSPPLYYLLLHGWMQAFGEGEAATRSLSLVFALLAIPVAAWAGSVLFGTSGGLVAAVLAAVLPFLTVYAQETRMYALLVVLSLVATAAFVRAAVHRDRRRLPLLAGALAALLWTHNWGLFLAFAIGVVWLGLALRGAASLRDLLLVTGVVLVAYAPWLPTLLDQIQHTGAPWSRRPGPGHLASVPRAVLGAAGMLVAVPIWIAALRRGRSDVALLLAVAAVAAVTAWTVAQLAPGWAVRYHAIFAGPLLLSLAGALSAARRRERIALGALVAACTLAPVPTVKSNARALAGDLALGRGDALLASAPEQVPVLSHYLDGSVRFFTPAGRVGEPRVTDWRDLVDRMRALPARAAYEQAVQALGRAGRLVLVRTVPHAPPELRPPLLLVSAARGRAFERFAARDRRLRRVAVERAPASLDVRAQLRLSVYAR